MKFTEPKADGYGEYICPECEEKMVYIRAPLAYHNYNPAPVQHYFLCTKCGWWWPADNYYNYCTPPWMIKEKE